MLLAELWLVNVEIETLSVFFCVCDLLFCCFLQEVVLGSPNKVDIFWFGDDANIQH